MKKLILLFALLVPIVLSAQPRKFSAIVTDGDTLTETASGDFLYVIEDPLGTPDTKAVRASSFVKTADAYDVDTTMWMLADTVVIGAFNSTATLTTGLIYGAFYNNGSDTLVVTEMSVSCLGTTVSFTVDIEWHATLDHASATHLNSTPPTITTEDGTIVSDTSFDNAEIPPGVQVWLKTPTVGTSSTFLSVTLLGYRKNATY